MHFTCRVLERKNKEGVNTELLCLGGKNRLVTREANGRYHTLK